MMYSWTCHTLIEMSEVISANIKSPLELSYELRQ